MAILVSDGVSPQQIAKLEAEWLKWRDGQFIFADFQHSGRFRGLHLDVINGRYLPEIWDDGGGPDSFELEIGNQVAHSAPLSSAGPTFKQLQTKWLPYYDPVLQQSRYTMVYNACLYDLEHVYFYAQRDLFFQAFDRLYKAHQEFLQMMFIGQQVYPIAYNKWIAYQLRDLLNMPGLADTLRPLLAIQQLDARNLNGAANKLRALVEEQA
ncbi:MAG: hypothetical protein AB8G95_30820, partial [Anaerolineae bacterium]